jgi:hypothetical protein
MPAGASGGVLCLSPFRALAKRASPGGTREQRRASTATQTLSGASHPVPLGQACREQLAASPPRARLPVPSLLTAAQSRKNLQEGEKARRKGSEPK